MSFADDESEIESSRAPLLEHLMELRKRLIICVVALLVGCAVCMGFSAQILEFLLQPYKAGSALVAYQNQHGVSHAFDPNLLLGLLGFRELPAVSNLSMQATGPLEVFISKLKIAAICGVALTFPVIGYQIYRFVAPGLYKRERKAFLPFLLATPFLFVLGAAMVYYVILPFLMYVSLNQQILNTEDVKVVLHLRVEDYLKIVTTLVFGFGLCFQLPVVVSLLALAGFVDSKQLRSFRRYAVVAVFVVAAVLTPPDPISMLTLAFPLVLLYEVSIWLVWVLDLRRKKEEAEAA